MAVQDDDLDLDVEAEEGASGGGSKKKIIIIAAAVLLFLAISGSATLLLLGGHSKPVAQAPAEGKEAGKQEAGVPAATPAAPLQYAALNPPFVVNFNNSEEVRFLQIDVQLSTRDPVLVEKIREHDPAIRNNLVILFSSQDPDELSSREGKEQLRKQVLTEVKKVLKQTAGSDAIENVYFTNFVMQ